MTRKKYTRWTDKEVITLKALLAQGLSRKQIAEQLGRRRPAIDHKVLSLGLAPKRPRLPKDKRVTKHKKGSTWTDTELALLKSMYSTGHTTKQTKAKLPRHSLTSVQHKINRLREGRIKTKDKLQQFYVDWWNDECPDIQSMEHDLPKEKRAKALSKYAMKVVPSPKGFRFVPQLSYAWKKRHSK